MRGCLGGVLAVVLVCGCACGIANLSVGTDQFLGGCCTQVEAADGFRLQLTTITAAAIALVGAVGVLLYWLLQRGERRAYDLLAVPMVIVFGFLFLDPFVRLADVKLDHSAARHHKVVVLDEYVITPRSHRTNTGHKTEYVLIVPAWRSGYGARMRLSVSEAMYDRAKKGSQVEVTSHPGLFGAEWLELTH